VEKKNPPPPPISTGNQKLVRLRKTKLAVLIQLYNEGKTTQYVKRIAINLMIDPKTVRFHLKSLKTLGLVKYSGDKNKTGIWNTTSKALNYIEGGEKTLVMYEEGVENFNEWLHPRSHNIKIKVSVLSRPSSNAWLDGWNPNPRIKNNIFYSKKFGDIGMTYTGKNIIFQLPELVFNHSDDAIAEGNKLIEVICLELEHEIEGLKLGEKTVFSQVISQHHAIVNEPFAKFMAKHGITYRDGTIDVDASTRTPELEFTDPKKAHEHVSNYIDYVKDFTTKDVPLASEITKILYENNLQIRKIQETQNQAIMNTQKQMENLTRLTSLAVERLNVKSDDSMEDWNKWTR
jgi:DNA-binding transcriptional ArsR family regulator